MHYLFLLFLLSVTNCFSKSCFHSPNDTLIENTVLDGQVTMNITQVHPTNDTLHFFWNKLEVNMPIEWEAKICDNSNCYLILEDFGATLPVLPGDDGLILIHCTPHVTEGTGIIRYTIFEENTPGQVDTLTWIINATALGLTTTKIETPFVWQKENKLYIEGSLGKYKTIRLINQIGQTVFEAQINNENIIEIPLISSAFYFIELKGDSNIYKQKILISE